MKNMEARFTLCETVQEELVGFFDSHDIRLFSQDLRRLFIDYLNYELPFREQRLKAYTLSACISFLIFHTH
jgi:hypothetical protein